MKIDEVKGGVSDAKLIIKSELRELRFISSNVLMKTVIIKNFMKKSVSKILFVAAFTMAASYNVYALQQDAEMSDLAMANVEALARRETYIPGGTCWGTGLDGENQTCNGGYTN